MSFISIESAWSRALVSISFLLLVVDDLPAQIVQSGRMEMVITDEQMEKVKAVGLGDRGMMLYRRLAAREQDQVELVKLDTALTQQWKGYITISKNFNLLRVQYREDLLFMLFKDRTYVGGDFLIVAVQLLNGNYGTYTVKNLIPFNPTEFIITNQAAMIGGYFNYRPLVLYYGFSSQRSKVLAGFFNSPGELNQLKTYVDGSFDVIVSARNFEKRKSLWIRNYDPAGDLVKTTVLQPEENKNLIFGRSVKLATGEQIVAGVYGRFSEYSRGIFVAGIDSIGQYTIRYYNFAELHNFFSYMKANRQKRIKSRIERKTIRGKKVKFNYRFLIHEIIPYQNQYIITGEAFYPHYSYPSSYYSGYRPSAYTTIIPGLYSSPMARNDLVFDGYQYTHAVVIGFDSNGKLVWDNSFEINDVRTMQLEQFVEVRPEKDRIVLMYLFENTLRTKIIRNSEVLEGKNRDAMKINSESEKVEVRNIESEQLDYWYGNYFYAYGVQRLKHETGSSRRVFFVNKIFYR